MGTYVHTPRTKEKQPLLQLSRAQNTPSAREGVKTRGEVPATTEGSRQSLPSGVNGERVVLSKSLYRHLPSAPLRENEIIFTLVAESRVPMPSHSAPV